MKPKTTEKALRKIESLARDMLEERYGDEDMAFDPIVAIPRLAHDGLEYVLIYIGFEGDETRLDASWSVGMWRKIHDQFPEDDMFCYVGDSLITKSEWDANNWDEYIQSRWMQ